MKIGDKVKIVKLRDPKEFLEDYRIRDTTVYVGEYGVIVNGFLDCYTVKFNNGYAYNFVADELQNVSSGG